jgi:hypothetical protein
VGVPSELIAAYRAAAYEVDVGESVICFRIDQPCPALDGLLRGRGVTSAVLLTAYNPRSQKRPADENMQAHRALLDAVAQRGNDSLPSRGRDPDDNWPAEPGLLILDLSRAEGLALAHRFEQYAFVWIETSQAPALVLVA